MLGWEFPPHFAGGAGIVCAELSKALNDKNVEVTFLMPSGPQNVYDKVNSEKQKLNILIANNLKKEYDVQIKTVDSLLQAYDSQSLYQQRYEELKEKDQANELYGSNLKEEIFRFADKAAQIAKDLEFDVIHAHDWVTFPAAIKIKEVTQKPLAVHVHITEFDKSGNLHADPFIYRVEKEGMDKSDIVITVSNRVKNRCISHYYTDPNKIRVVHNAATPMNDELHEGNGLKKGRKMVLFAGRVTMQKGPEFLMRAAKKVCQIEDNVLFAVAGSGDMLPKMKAMAKEYDIEDQFYFHGFYTREEAEQLFSMADVFIMPSVSEPFGVVPFEAQMKKTPTIISKQSGISEVLQHSLKVDFWDINQMASKIISLLHYEELHQELQEKGYSESKQANWDGPASKCLNIYHEMMMSRN